MVLDNISEIYCKVFKKEKNVLEGNHKFWLISTERIILIHLISVVHRTGVRTYNEKAWILLSVRSAKEHEEEA